jgi:alpha-aminoadipic semialdehyde synthase
LKNTFGIVRETKNQWEKRVPLIPEDLKRLVQKLKIDVKIQPSPLRIFSDDAYRSAGIRVDEDLSDRDIIVGIKEIKPADLSVDKVYLYFSHTIKGQDYNMPMLQRLLDLNCTLIDYERMVNEQNQRLIYFSYHAGVAGIIDTLWAFGKRLQEERIDSPFGLLKQAYHYTDQADAEKDFKKLAALIKKDGLPGPIKPLVIGITGYGNVSRGVQHLLDLLPVKYVQPEEICQSGDRDPNQEHTIYLTIFKEQDMVRPISENDTFRLQDYYENPEKYQADFDRYLPHLSILVNASFWDTPYPRHVSKEALRNLFSQNKPVSLRVIGDISCDIEGGIECTVKATDPGNPVYVYQPQTGRIKDGTGAEGILIMAVDNLPSELPKDASVYFSSVFKDYIAPLSEADFKQDFDSLNLPYALKKAVIVHQGQLTEEYRYLEEYLK